MSGNFKDYFSGNSSAYADFRPSYPQALAVELSKRCSDTQLLLDCGCGTGQLSVLMADYFSQVIAIDASPQQIDAATRDLRVTYQVAAAESTGMSNHSVDMVTVAQAAHWLNLESFYGEVKRVLKPNGVLALITYGICHIDDSDCDAALNYFYHEVLAEFWPPERKHVEAGYRSLDFPFAEIDFPAMKMYATWNLHDLLGYVTTWSALKVLVERNGASAFTLFQSSLLSDWGNAEIKRNIEWPLSVRLGKA